MISWTEVGVIYAEHTYRILPFGWQIILYPSEFGSDLDTTSKMSVLGHSDLRL